MKKIFAMLFVATLFLTSTFSAVITFAEEGQKEEQTRYQVVPVYRKITNFVNSSSIYAEITGSITRDNTSVISYNISVTGTNCSVSNVYFTTSGNHVTVHFTLTYEVYSKAYHETF